MSNYTTKEHQYTTDPPSAGDIQAQIDLRLLARLHLGPPLFSSATADTHINPFNPDSSDLHVFSSHYRDPVTGDRGSAIKFLQKLLNMSYERAVGYCWGWLDAQNQEGGSL